jgi:putative nucleotidyltransferase with HDIG domain
MTAQKYKSPAQINGLINRIFKLQALPQNVASITQLLNNEHTMAEDIAKEIEKDPPFSAQILKLVNSGFYGISQPITSISHATVIVGFRVMKTLIMSSSLANMITKSFDGLWQHSITCARTCSMLSRILGVEDPEELSSIGLLHDIGKVVIAQYMKEEFEAIMDLTQKQDLLIVEAEERIIHITHADIAKLLLSRWNIPASTVEPIANHHNFNPNSDYAVRTAIVHLADILVRSAGFGSGGDTQIPELNPDVLKILQIKKEELPGIINEMFLDSYEFV